MKEPRNPFTLGHRISRSYFCARYEEEKAFDGHSPGVGLGVRQPPPRAL